MVYGKEERGIVQYLYNSLFHRIISAQFRALTPSVSRVGDMNPAVPPTPPEESELCFHLSRNAGTEMQLSMVSSLHHLSIYKQHLQFETKEINPAPKRPQGNHSGF